MSYDELSAINFVLSQVGAAPVDNLSKVLPDLVSAQTRLAEANIWVQKRGWWFNKLLNQVLVPNTETGNINLPAGTIKIQTDYPVFLIARDLLVYDPLNDTLVFTQSVCADITILLIFEDAPLSVQDAVMYRAAAAMVQHELEDMNKYKVLMDEANQAYALLKTEDLEIKQRHAYTTPAVQRLMSKVRPYKRNSGAYNPVWPGGRSI
jgi:hypothetical protein